MMWFLVFESQQQAVEKVPLHQSILVRAGDLRICIAHTPTGFFAVDDTCTHQNAYLHKGTINEAEEIICPWHQFRFSLQTGEETSGHNCRSLRTYPLEWRNEGLFICLPFSKPDER
jgi:nitrite reductase/ring-hydroxylating ferredoxin subunit